MFFSVVQIADCFQGEILSVSLPRTLVISRHAVKVPKKLMAASVQNAPGKVSFYSPHPASRRNPSIPKKNDESPSDSFSRAFLAGKRPPSLGRHLFRIIFHWRVRPFTRNCGKGRFCPSRDAFLLLSEFYEIPSWVFPELDRESSSLFLLRALLDNRDLPLPSESVTFRIVSFVARMTSPTHNSSMPFFPLDSTFSILPSALFCLLAGPLLGGIPSEKTPLPARFHGEKLFSCRRSGLLPSGNPFI